MAKSISGSVGQGGRNFPLQDVLTVQYLLNCVPHTQGGPSPELVLDGVCGPKTRNAIAQFQRRTFGFTDGRVDPGGRTLLALQKFDPAPNQGLGPAPGAFGKGGHIKGGPGFGQKHGFPQGFKEGPGFGHKGSYPQGFKDGPGFGHKGSFPGSKLGSGAKGDPWSKG